MSEDSYAARRAMRVAGPASDGEDDEEVNAGDHQGTGQVQRPGQETEEPTAQGKQGGSNRQPRPKLTYELLTAPVGIPTVFGSFREAFHKQRNGRSNVTRDLGLLLELYEQWQKQVFPHDDFETFSRKVANLYGRPGGKTTKSATLKADMRQLRESVIELALEGMGNAMESDAPMDEDAQIQGNSADPEDEMYSEAMAGAGDKTAASQCDGRNFDAVGVVGNGHENVHKRRRAELNDPRAASATQSLVNENLADAEVDELLMAQAADDEFLEGDLEDMMVTA